LVLLIVAVVALSGCIGGSGSPKTPNVSIKSLNASQKASLSQNLASIKPITQKAAVHLGTLESRIASKNDPKLTGLVKKIRKLHSGNTITDYEENITQDINQQDENLDEDMLELQLEIDAEIILTKDLENYTNQIGDANITQSVNDLESDFKDMRKDQQDNIKELNTHINENDSNVDVNQNVDINVVDSTDIADKELELEREYGIQANDLDDMDQEDLQAEASTTT